MPTPPAKPQPSRLSDNYQTYSVPSAAAAAALRGIDNKRNETGGGILYNKEQDIYAATEPVGQNDDAHFSAAVSVPRGWTLHSTYHTHPAGPRSTLFSGDDITTSQQLKAPSYVLALGDNKIRIFDPASSKVLKDTSTGRFSNGSFSYGDTVDESKLPKPLEASEPEATAQTPPVKGPPTATVPVAGSRVTMKDFVTRHRAQTTKYRHQIVHIK